RPAGHARHRVEVTLGLAVAGHHGRRLALESLPRGREDIRVAGEPRERGEESLGPRPDREGVVALVFGDLARQRNRVWGDMRALELRYLSPAGSGMDEEANEPLEAVLRLTCGAVDGFQLRVGQDPFSRLPYRRPGNGLHRGAVDDVLPDAP